MYSCLECGYEFQNPIRLTEKHNLSCPPYENIYVCPHCKANTFKEVKISHCHCCGAKLNENQIDYCSEECKLRGEKLWKKEVKRKKLLADSNLYKLVREVELYNRRNKTSYSYGQYVALVKTKRRNKKHGTK